MPKLRRHLILPAVVRGPVRVNTEPPRVRTPGKHRRAWLTLALLSWVVLCLLFLWLSEPAQSPTLAAPATSIPPAPATARQELFEQAEAKRLAAQQAAAPPAAKRINQPLPGLKPLASTQVLPRLSGGPSSDPE